MKKIFVVVFVLSIFSCTESDIIDDFDIAMAEHLRVRIASSRMYDGTNTPKYWVRSDTSFVWNTLVQKIDGFQYEEGYEYLIDVYKLGNQYKLASVVSKTRKESVVPLLGCNDFGEHSTSLFLPDGLMIDSMYVFQNDMLLTEKQYDKLNSWRTRSLITYNDPNCGYWQNRNVYYIFAPDFQYVTLAQQAIQEWSNKTLLNFVNSTGQGDYIEFQNLDMAGVLGLSNLGRVGGRQTIQIGSGATKGTIMHEIGHALGLYHEHMRNDRDNYVTILWDNIPESMHSQFLIPNYSQDSGQFDFASIMLYSSWQGAMDATHPSMKTIDGYTFGAQRTYISDGDSAGIASIPVYGPPIYKLIQTVENVQENVWGNVEEGEWDCRYTIKCYSDRYKTILMTLTTSKVVNLKIHHIVWDENQQRMVETVTTQQVTLAAGSNTYDIGTVHNIENYYMGNPTSYDVTIYEIE